MLRRISACALALATSTIAARAIADDEKDQGPKIELAPEHASDAKAKPPPVALGTGEATDYEYLHGMTELRLRRAEDSWSSTSLGGYGEAQLAGIKSGSDRRDWTADLSRVIVFVAHDFSPRFRFYSEIEWEHARACAIDCKGEVSMEQAYLDAKLFGDKLALRGGAIIVPMGIVNQWHEPPVFHGVFRPDVETFIIPSTWHEIGVGAFGSPIEGLRFEVYAVTAFDPTTITTQAGLAESPQEGSLARANAPAATGRIEWEPLLGVVAGAAGYATDAGPNEQAYDATGARVYPAEPIFGFDLDVRARLRGLEAKALYTEFRLPNAGALMRSFDALKAPLISASAPIPEILRGGYVELAYDVLHPFGVTQQLLPFARVEAFDTQAKVPDGFTADGTMNVHEVTMGLTYRPIQAIVVKSDVQFKRPRAGASSNQLDFGFGFMY